MSARVKRRATGAPFVLPFDERRRLHGRAYRAQQRDQSEVCGLVLVVAGGRLRFHFLQNRSMEAGKYELPRHEADAASQVARQSGQRVLGSFHSHPISEAKPSKEDIDRGFFRGYELIYDVCGREVHLWRLGQTAGKALPKEVEIALEPQPRASAARTAYPAHRRAKQRRLARRVRGRAPANP